MDLQVLRVVTLFCIAADFTRTEETAPGYVGCFKDEQDRTLSKQLSNSNTNTGSACIKRCKNENYRYAGTEHGNECFCSHDLHGILVVKSECYVSCPGNRNELCGGDWRLSVYDMWPVKPYTPSGYVGCFKDKDEPYRSLPRKLPDSDKNTGSECKRRCKSEAFRYAGTEFGSQCYCGHNLPGMAVQNLECYNTCPGNRSEHCGGYWHLSVYDTRHQITSTNRPVHHTVTHTSSSSRPSVHNHSPVNTKPTGFDDSTTYTSSLFETTEIANTTATTATFNGTIGRYNGSTTESRIAAGAEQKTVLSNLENHVTKEVTGQPMHETTHESSSTKKNTKPTFDDRSTTHTLYPSKTTEIANASVATTICNGTIKSYVGSTTESKHSTGVEKQNITYSMASNAKAEWVTIKNKQFLIAETEEAFFVAKNISSNLSAELLSYSNPLQYFYLPSIIQLKLKSYWIGVYVLDIPGSECPILSKTDTNTEIRLVHCSNINPFICSRTVTNAKVEYDHEFAALLKDMTVNVKETYKAKRKLISAEDRRRSAKFIGGTGIIIICACVVCMVRVDINWKRCNCSKK